jgi:hypothetical protein
VGIFLLFPLESSNMEFDRTNLARFVNKPAAPATNSGVFSNAITGASFNNLDGALLSVHETLVALAGVINDPTTVRLDDARALYQSSL